MGTQHGETDRTERRDPAKPDQGEKSTGSPATRTGGDPARPVDEDGRPLRYVDSPGAALAGDEDGEADEVPEPNEPA